MPNNNDNSVLHIAFTALGTLGLRRQRLIFMKQIPNNKPFDAGVSNTYANCGQDEMNRCHDA
jgi:hypothetical protein